MLSQNGNQVNGDQYNIAGDRNKLKVDRRQNSGNSVVRQIAIGLFVTVGGGIVLFLLLGK